MTQKGLVRLFRKPSSLPSPTISEGEPLSRPKDHEISLEKNDGRGLKN
jgi:hypothetical protein